VCCPVRTANLRTKYNGLSNRMHASLESMNSRLPGEAIIDGLLLRANKAA